VAITLNSVTNENDAIVCSFSVNTREGVTAFAALASAGPDMSNGTKGPEFDNSVSQAWVTPTASAGDTVYVAVAAYAESVEVARSNAQSIAYQPVSAPPPPPPPPPPLQPMTLTLVEQITPADIRVHFSGNTPANGSRYEVQQLVNGEWVLVTDGIEASSRTWEGGPVPYMDAVRLVVFDTLGQSAASNEVTITLMGPPPPPPPPPPLHNSPLLFRWGRRR